ncbi:MAG TPA: hypothetical protein VLE71_04040 [Actinomycetota bacterium]|nr:hypothetical protein [Actinomycetota bacterium]
MNDLERDLRTLLDEKASTAGTPVPDARLLRRARRRQVGTALAGALGVAALAGGVALAMWAFGPSHEGMPADRLVPLVETTVNGVTVTHPGTWDVVDPVEAGIEPQTETPTRLIVLMTNAEEITPESISCPGLSGGAGNGVVMTIQEVPLALAGEGARPWPVELVPLIEPGQGEVGPSGCLPGWTFLRASWTANGRGFEARAGFGPDVSREERDALQSAFDTLRFAPAEGAPEAVVLATGTAGGEDWQLIAQRARDGMYIGLEWSSGGAGMGGMSDVLDPLQYTARYLGSGADRELVVYGTTTSPIARVEYVPSDGGPAVSTEVIDVPDEIGGKLDAFVLSASDPGVGSGILRGYGRHDEVVAEIDVPTPAE